MHEEHLQPLHRGIEFNATGSDLGCGNVILDEFFSDRSSLRFSRRFRREEIDQNLSHRLGLPLKT